MDLSDEQRVAVGFNGHAIVTACPGSGKTRVLTCRVLRGLRELGSSKQRVVALTYTNRAADEIQSRLDRFDVPTDCLWAGTIHSFALEWILRPYAPYVAELKNGFSVADEHHTGRLIEELKAAKGLKEFDEVSTSRSRTGENSNTGVAASVFAEYKAKLRSQKLLDYDDILYCAYKLLVGNPEISETLAHVMPLICVDEVQDMQDLQYGILSQIVNGKRKSNTLFLVGDENQAIYESLGSLSKTTAQIADEFGLSEIKPLKLTENYRSTQRIVDYFTLIRPGTGALTSLAKHAKEVSRIQFDDQTINREGLAKYVAGLVRQALDSGVPPSDICIIAPRWWHIIALARALIRHLPDVDFDAPGLSPLHSTRDNIWFKVARLFLTKPEPNLTRTRLRWAKEVISELKRIAKASMPDEIRTPRLLLRFVNSTTSSHTDGLAYLRDVFAQLVAVLGINMDLQPELSDQLSVFFEKAESRMAKADGGMPSDIASLRKLFRSPAGVVVNTCHGVKGEEYHTVIALGLLKGYIPHWDLIIKKETERAREQASKLLYVICSRAKKQLYLIAEFGHETKKGAAYVTCEELGEIIYDYDK